MQDIAAATAGPLAGAPTAPADQDAPTPAVSPEVALVRVPGPLGRGNVDPCFPLLQLPLSPHCLVSIRFVHVQSVQPVLLVSSIPLMQHTLPSAVLLILGFDWFLSM